MIRDREDKIAEIVETINNRLGDFNRLYRSGPDLYFYRKILMLREQSGTIEEFLDSEYTLEVLYATLLSWDMNSRGAKMKYFDDFKSNVLSCSDQLIELEQAESRNHGTLDGIEEPLQDVYKRLDLMKTKSRLVSNSKLLHYLFPRLLMPMDRRNTLTYFYGTTHETLERYM